MEEQLDYSKLRYVLYARKSTTDESRQVRSIGDQISDCELFAKRININIVDTIKEEKSAKKPQNRPKFTQLLRDIRAGKYDGILAWNPDRLARNMLEGGTIIDMVDNNVIKDLKFVNQYFTKDANGKMLLGMAFVLSKQYSDDLSQKVTRGVRKSLQEGKIASYKHGYVRDDNGLQQPDGSNFDLICDAWKKRLEGISLEAIAGYLNEKGYARTIKHNGKQVTITKQILSGIFKDPFYYGNLKQKNEEINLFSIYDFKAVITEKEFFEVQKLSGVKIQPYKKTRATYYPLKMMVICSFCGNHMYVGAVQGHKYKYLTYRCGYKYCTRVKKSIRGKVIFDFLYEFLGEGLNFGEKEYQQYLEAMKQLSGSKRYEIETTVHSQEARLKIVEREIADIAVKVLSFAEGYTVREVNEGRIEEFKKERDELKAELSTLKASIVDPEEEALTYQNFLNLCKNAGTAIQMGDSIVKDAICRLLFLNFSVDESKVLSYQSKPAFAELLKTRDVLLGRGKRT